MGSNTTLETSTQQEKWLNQELGLHGTNSGRRWHNKADGKNPKKPVLMEAKISGIVKGGVKQITVKKSDLELIECHAHMKGKIPILVGAFKDEEPEDQFVIMRFSEFIRLYKLAERGEKDA